MRDQIHKTVVAGSLIALSALSLPAKALSQQREQERPGETPTAQRTDAPFAADFKRIEGKLQQGPVDITEDVEQLGLKIKREIQNHFQFECPDPTYNGIEKQFSELVSLCASHLSSAGVEDLPVVTKNIAAIASVMEKDTRSCSTGSEGLFKGGHIEKMLSAVTEDDELNRARLEAVQEIFTAYQYQIEKDSVLAFTKFIPAVVSADETGAETKRYIRELIPAAIELYKGCRCNADAEWLKPNRDLVACYRGLLAEGKPGVQEFRDAVDFLPLLQDAEPALRFDTAIKKTDGFADLMEELIELQKFGLQGAQSIADTPQWPRLRMAALQNVSALAPLPIEVQDRYYELIVDHCLKPSKDDVQAMLDCIEAIQGRDFDGRKQSKSDWGEYFLFKTLAEHSSFFTGPIESLQAEALNGGARNEQRAIALTSLVEVEDFLQSIIDPALSYRDEKREFSFPTVFPIEEDRYENSVEAYRSAASSWIGERRSYETSTALVELQALKLTSYETRGMRQVQNKLVQAVAESVEREMALFPEKFPEFVETVGTALSDNLPEEGQSALLRVLRSSFAVEAVWENGTDKAAAILAGNIARTDSPDVLWEAGQTLRAGELVESDEGPLAVPPAPPWEKTQPERLEMLPPESRAFGKLHDRLFPVMNGDVAISREMLSLSQAEESSDRELRSVLGDLRHNVALTLIAALDGSPDSVLRASRLEHELAGCQNATELGERTGLLFRIYRMHSGETAVEQKQGMSAHAAALRAILFDGVTEEHVVEGHTRRYTTPAILNRITEQSTRYGGAAAESRYAWQEDFQETAEFKKEQMLNRLRFSESFHRVASTENLESRVEFLKALGLYGSEATDPTSTLNLYRR